MVHELDVHQFDGLIYHVDIMVAMLCLETNFLLSLARMGLGLSYVRSSIAIMYMFDFSRTVGWIIFKFGRDMLRVGLYLLCSNGQTPVVHGDFMNVFVHF